MITGHIATTLVAKREAPSAPWWLLFVSAYLIDLVMFTLVALGIEKLENAVDAQAPTMPQAIIEMTYSHDLLAQFFWIPLAGVIAYLVTKNRKIVIIAMLLSLGHWAGDLISGYGHFVHGPDSTPLGTDWYHTNFIAALIFESLLGLACVYWFVRDREFSLLAKAGLLFIFVVSPFFLLLV